MSNVSKKAYRYHFETASEKHIHPMKGVFGGTDRMLVTPQLLVLADTGHGEFSQFS